MRWYLVDGWWGSGLYGMLSVRQADVVLQRKKRENE